MKLPARRLAGRLLLAVVCLASPAVRAAAGPASGTLPAKIVVALKPDKNPDQMLAEKRALEAFLAEQFGRPAEVVIPLASATILEGFANGTVDLGYLSATDMVHARDRGLADLLLAGEIAGRNWYESYWVALRDKPCQGVADLRGRPVAFASRTSTSGYVVPLWDLRQRGLIGPQGRAEDFFGAGNVWFGSGYVSAIERVLQGEAEAAAVSYYVLDLDKHLTAGQRARLRRIASQGPVPTHVIAVRASLPPAACEALRAGLLELNQPAHAALRDKVFTSKLVVTDAAAHLGSLKDALQLAVPAR